MRGAFINQLVIEARLNDRIFLLVGDLGYSVVEIFAREFPGRFINVGVAEQNMAGVAAGLASEGYHVFIYSIANFPTFRCAEQIRNDICYHRYPVTVVAVGGGLAYGNLGYSHHAVQDYALMRSFPEMLVCSPGDPVETRETVKYLCRNPQASYLRLGKAGEPIIHHAPPRVDPGELVHVSGHFDTDKMIIVTGGTLKLALEAIALRHDMDWKLCSLPIWGEICRSRVARSLESIMCAVVVEDHLRAGGFGSYLQEVALDYKLPIELRVIALATQVSTEVGRQNTLNARGGLSVKSIAEAIY